MWYSIRILFGISLLAVCYPMAAEELAGTGTLRPEAPYLHPIIRPAGYIFAGTVQSVTKISPLTSSVATVQISFHVDEAFRGVRTGQTLSIREWAGLWNSGERYRPGERVLLFLYPASKLGLTSPVGGAMGRFAVSSKGRVIVPPGRVEFPPKSRGSLDSSSEETEFTPSKLVRMMRTAEPE
jgi:hypothetical protein